MLSYSLIQPSSCQKCIRMLYINLNQESVPKEIFRDDITCDEISLQNEKLYIVELYIRCSFFICSRIFFPISNDMRC